MTREEIMALSGVSLRRAVAEEVMGYWVYHYTKGPRGYYMLLDDEDHPLGGLERKTEEEAWADCPPFEEDMAAAWQVVQKMRDKGFIGCELRTYGSYLVPDSIQYVARFHWHGAGSAPYAIAQQPEEALCKAALLAVLQEGEST